MRTVRRVAVVVAVALSLGGAPAGATRPPAAWESPSLVPGWLDPRPEEFEAPLLRPRPGMPKSPARRIAKSILVLSTPEYEVSGDWVERARAADHLRLGESSHQLDARDLSAGLSMFTAAIFLAAFPPPGLRRVFLGEPHIGPAWFHGGGVGLGLGWRF